MVFFDSVDQSFSAENRNILEHYTHFLEGYVMCVQNYSKVTVCASLISRENINESGTDPCSTYSGIPGDL